MTAQKVPGAGHDIWGGGAPQVQQPRAQEPPAAESGNSGSELTPIDGSADSWSPPGEPKDREAISLGGFRQVLIIVGILAAGLLLAFVIHMFVL